MRLPFAFYKAKYFKLSFVSRNSGFVMSSMTIICFKVPMLCMQVCSYLPNHLSVSEGGSLLS